MKEQVVLYSFKIFFLVQRFMTSYSLKVFSIRRVLCECACCRLLSESLSLIRVQSFSGEARDDDGMELVAGDHILDQSPASLYSF